MLKKTALVTGANKGIGKQVALRLAKDGYSVYIGCRDAAKGGQAISDLQSQSEAPLDLHTVVIEVSSDASVADAAKFLGTQISALDVLVNNAGILIEDPASKPSESSLLAVQETYNVNVFGVIRTTQAFLPLLRAAKGGARIVNVSSGLGSVTKMANSPDWGMWNLVGYNSSKSAVNAITVAFAKELKPFGIKVNAADPGYCDTEMTAGLAAPRSASQGANVIVSLAELPDDGPTATFRDENGTLQW